MMTHCYYDKSYVYIPLGKGGKVFSGSESSEIQQAAVFRKNYINGIQVNYPFTLLLTVESSASHSGRKSIKYSNRIVVKDEKGDILHTNENFYREAEKAIGINEDACWFIYEIIPKNQDELHFKAIIVNRGESKNYPDSVTRKEEWIRLIQNFDNSYVSDSNVAKGVFQGPTTQTIFYGCPGTGKSYKVKTLTEGDEGQFAVYFDENGKRRPLPETETERLSTPSNVFRTTFHPDYDYASFVGTYKPLMNENNELIYDFVPQVFTKAYIRAYQSLSDDTLLGNDKNVYLIIEEINRGNCAQIFGDLFQLLDRKDGWSDYSITPDTELKDYLSKLEGVPSDKLRLPGNLHILATMNTSDQSLFPMDSAFKRRWAMEYIPIKYEETDSNKAKDFILTLYGKEYKWLEFLKKANALIRKATDSEDKQMGEYFIKSSIDETEFINKVMFYIWNDVCKDHYSASSRISRGYFMRNSDKEKDIFTFAELFSGRAAEGEVSEATPEQLITNFMKHIGVDEENKPKENATTETEQIAEQQ